MKKLFERLFKKDRSGLSISGKPLCGQVSVTAHSGCMDLADNSLEAMAAGIAAGAGIVEFDLHYNANGTPVLSHRTPKKAPCVTLAQAFDFLAQHGSVRANVDVKSTEYLEKLPALAEAAGVTKQIFFTGVKEADVETVRTKCPGIPYYLNVSVRGGDDVDALAEKTAALGAVGINLNLNDVSAKLIKAFHERGMPVSVWTVNKERDAVRFLRLGADNITTRRPDMVCGLLKKTD